MTRDNPQDILVDRMREYAEAAGPPLREQFRGFGPKYMTDAELSRELVAKLQQFPPSLVPFPDGSVRYVSPFLAALAEVEGGKQMLNRIRKLYGGQ